MQLSNLKNVISSKFSGSFGSVPVDGSVILTQYIHLPWQLLPLELEICTNLVSDDWFIECLQWMFKLENLLSMSFAFIVNSIIFSWKNTEYCKIAIFCLILD